MIKGDIQRTFTVKALTLAQKQDILATIPRRASDFDGKTVVIHALPDIRYER